MAEKEETWNRFKGLTGVHPFTHLPHAGRVWCSFSSDTLESLWKRLPALLIRKNLNCSPVHLFIEVIKRFEMCTNFTGFRLRTREFMWQTHTDTHTRTHHVSFSKFPLANIKLVYYINLFLAIVPFLTITIITNGPQTLPCVVPSVPRSDEANFAFTCEFN